MIDNINFKIGDYYELLALHKALLEAKFHQEPNNIEVCFSPIVAKLSNEIVDALTNFNIEKKKLWEDWRKLENHSDFRNIALMNACSYSYWLKLNYCGKVDACKALLSPFLTTQNDIELFIEEVEQKMEEKNEKYYIFSCP